MQGWHDRTKRFELSLQMICSSHVQALPGNLTLHAADLTKEGSFDSILKVSAALRFKSNFTTAGLFAILNAVNLTAGRRLCLSYSVTIHQRCH